MNGHSLHANGGTSCHASTSQGNQPTQVLLNVYDVNKTTSANTNTAIARINNVTREIGLGGVFHGAIQIFGDYEWSFGFCEKGTGVYCCRARENPAYTYRESIDLGSTSLRKEEVKAILTHLKANWHGNTYELFNRNCCHFCEALCIELGVKQPPGWLNRFASGAEAMVNFTNDASTLARAVGVNVSRSAATASSWLQSSWTRFFEPLAGDNNDTSSGSGAAASGSPAAAAASSQRGGSPGAPPRPRPPPQRTDGTLQDKAVGSSGDGARGYARPLQDAATRARRHSEGGSPGDAQKRDRGSATQREEAAAALVSRLPGHTSRHRLSQDGSTLEAATSPGGSEVGGAMSQGGSPCAVRQGAGPNADAHSSNPTFAKRGLVLGSAIP